MAKNIGAMPIFEAEETMSMIHHVCFPTDIFEIPNVLNDVDMKAMLKYIENQYATAKDGHENWQTGPDLHTKPEFEKLVRFLITTNKDLIKGKGYDVEDIKISDMWANILKPKEAHSPHTHSNNYLSGVYYLYAEKASALVVFDPVSERDVIKPRMFREDIFNSAALMFHSIPNTAYIFPSWLRHYVPPNVSERNRISISWNIQLKGQVGEHHDFQSAEYK